LISEYYSMEDTVLWVVSCERDCDYM
jgi:hypothetical protein